MLWTHGENGVSGLFAMSNKFRITERFESQQQWAESGGLVDQHEAMASDAIKRNDEQQQRLADLRGGEMYEFDILDRAYRDAHPAKISDEEMEKQIAWGKAAVAQWEKGRA